MVLSRTSPSCFWVAFLKEGSLEWWVHRLSICEFRAPSFRLPISQDSNPWLRCPPPPSPKIHGSLLHFAWLLGLKLFANSGFFRTKPRTVKLLAGEQISQPRVLPQVRVVDSLICLQRLARSSGSPLRWPERVRRLRAALRDSEESKDSARRASEARADGPPRLPWNYILDLRG